MLSAEGKMNNRFVWNGSTGQLERYVALSLSELQALKMLAESANSQARHQRFMEAYQDLQLEINARKTRSEK
jgi:hypothetical protein